MIVNNMMNNKVRCKCCGEIIDYVFLRFLDLDGKTLYDFDAGINVSDDGQITIQTDEYWYGCEVGVKKSDTIICPKCGGYPFSDIPDPLYYNAIMVVCETDEENVIKE